MSNARSLPVPVNEPLRLTSLERYKILDTEEEKDLNELTALAASMFDMPISLITILDQNRQWFKSRYGFDVKETDRALSFCQYTIMGDKAFEVENADTDERFQKNSLVTEYPKMKYYCGVPLVNKEGYTLGTLCVIDKKPRKLSENQIRALEILSKIVMTHFELHYQKNYLEEKKNELEKTIEIRTKEINENIITLKERDQELQKVNDELKKVIYKASHDLRGPLKTMMGITDLALSESKKENIYNFLSLLKATQIKLDNTLDDLLKVVEIKEREPEFHPVDWNKIIKSASETAKEEYNEKEPTIEFNCENQKTFYSDSSMLTTMMHQLIINSIQYNISEHPTINIKLEQDKKKQIIKIKDNGIGIKENEKNKIFEMFYKNARSRGSGLGLYIVKNIVDLLKGGIKVESDNSKGTIFTIEFPLNSD
ncbi:MAG: GAF domain-containing sensor histidine kinase [Cytophagaceae bacterium]